MSIMQQLRAGCYTLESSPLLIESQGQGAPEDPARELPNLPLEDALHLFTCTRSAAKSQAATVSSLGRLTASFGPLRGVRYALVR